MPVQTYIDANGQGRADGAGWALVFIGGLILLAVLIYPAAAWLAIRMVYTPVRRARA